MGRAGIFVSHSSQNNVLAHNVADRLRMLGYDPFVDFQGIAGGTQWETEIYDAMRRSVAVVLCGTQAAVDSKWVTAELILARYAGKPIVPLLLEPCRLPELLDQTQAIDFSRDPETGYRKLDAALAHLQGKQPALREVVWPAGKSPYPGLFAFTEDYAPLFFGRERELDDAIETLRQRGRPVRFLAVIGPSGSGKSSFVRAGLVPKLKAGAIPGSEAWTYAPVFTPGTSPFRNLAVSLRIAGKNVRRVADIEAALREKRTGLLDEVVDLLEDSAARVVIVVDQFEELERQSPRSETEAFVTAIRESLAPPDSPLLVLATLRADFVAAVLQFPGMSELIAQGNRMLGPIERSAMRRLIEEPARYTNLAFAPGIVDELLDETHHAEALAHLAFILRELWDKAADRQPREVTRAIRDQVGSLSDVLARRAQAVLDESDARDREAVIEQLTRLADVDDKGEFTRKRLPLTTVPAERRDALLRFVDAHLLVTSVDDKSQEQLLSVAHEALFRSWPALRTRLSADSERIRLRRDLEHDSAEWRRASQPASSLWRGERLAAALALIDADGIKADDVRARFVTASKQADQQSLARESRLLATIAERELEVDPERAILLSLAAIDEYAWTPDAERTLRALLDESHCRGRLVHDGAVADLVFSPDGAWILTASDDATAKVWEVATGRLLHTLAGHQAPVRSGAFDPGSRLAITVSHDRTARIWSVETGAEQTVLRGHEDWVRTAAWSADGRSVLTASEDKTARIWNPDDGAVRQVLRGHVAPVTMAMFSRDGTMVVTASDDRTIRFWNAATGDARLVLRGHTAAVRSVAVSGDESLAVSAHQDGTARIWDLAAGQERFVLRGHASAVTTAAFRGDDRMVTTGSEDKTVRLWDVGTGAERHVLRGHTAAVRRAAFTVDGDSVVSAADDRTIRIWDVAAGTERRSLRGHDDRPTAIAFSPDGRSLASASDDRSARIWNLGSGAEGHVLQRQSEVAAHALFSPDGAALIASDAKVARVWDVRTGQERYELSGHGAAVRSVDVSPDGRWIVTASDDRTARIWTAGNGTLHRVLDGHDDWVRSAMFNADGTLVVTASQDNSARLWDTASGTSRHVMRGHDDYVRGALFSPDGSLVITASEDNTARIWSVVSGATLQVLRGHEGPVASPAFSPDGSLVITASRDRTVRIWQVDTGAELHVLRSHQAPVSSVRFSPDGKSVLSTSDDRTVRVWDVATGTERQVLQGHEGVLWTAALNRDATLLVTASADRTARIWDLSAGLERHILRGHEGPVWSAVFSPDGLSVATASSDRTVRIWSFRPVESLLTFARGRVYRQLSGEERRRFGLPST